MTLRKRLRVLYAALTQEWHEKRCGECGATWMAVGPLHSDLIDFCDDCEQIAIDRLADLAEREYQKGGAR
jgi:hypothetical protein